MAFFLISAYLYEYMFFIKPDISLIKSLQNKIQCENLFGADSSLATLFLLQSRYKVLCAVTDDFLFRFYDGNTESQKGFLYPLKINPDAKTEDGIKELIKYSSEKNEKLRFCLCTEEQKNELTEILNKLNPGKEFVWKSDSGDSDYIYLQEKLSTLAGSKLQKKRNHVNQFKITFENQWKFDFFDSEKFNESYKEDIKSVLKKWQTEKGEFTEDLKLEDESINLAVENFSALNLCGGILYISGFPVAFTIASRISNEVLDVHFEKAVSDYARNGAFTAINQFFIQNCSNFKYVNREDDMNVEGLRHAKLSYKPEIILSKYFAEIDF